MRPLLLISVWVALASATLGAPAETDRHRIAREVYAANPAQHSLPSELQIPALEDALQAERQVSRLDWREGSAYLSENAWRDLLFLWTRWYGLERDEWLPSRASTEFCLLRVTGGPGSPSRRAAALRGIGRQDAYVLPGGAVLAFDRGYLCDVPVHQDPVLALSRSGSLFADATVRIASRLQSAEAPGDSWLALEGRMRPGGLQVSRWATDGTSLTLDDLLGGLASFREALPTIRGGYDELRGRLVLPCANAARAEALAARIKNVAPQAPATYSSGRMVHTVMWDQDLAALLAHDHAAPRGGLFPPRGAGLDYVAAMKRAVSLRPSFWAGSRRRRLQLMVLCCLLVVALAAVVLRLLYPRRRGPSARLRKSA